MIGLGLVLAGVWPWLVLLLPLVGWVGVWVERRRQRRRAALWGRREAALLGSPVHHQGRLVCGVAALSFVGLALLQPVWGEAPGEPAGPEVVICLDVSRSMLARDVLPSRLVAAQREVETAAEHAFGARFGLVVFAGSAQLAVPLTADLGSVATIAAAMDPSVVARGGTDLGAAIEVATAALQRGGSRAGCIVVLTDGEDFAGLGRAAAARAAVAGFVVHCLGFGSVQGSKVVVDTPAGEVFLRDAGGQDVVSALDAPSLGRVAAAGGGRFTTAVAGGLADLYATALLPRGLAAAIADPQREQAHRFQWPLLAALLAWMLRSVIPERRR